MRACVRSAAVGAAALVLALTSGSPLAAQTIVGRVVDGVSGQPVAGAEIRLLGAVGDVISQELSTAEGTFLFRGLAPGTYALAVERFGYESHRTEGLEPDGDRPVRVEIPLQPAAIPLEELRVTAGLQRQRHEPTYGGLYARHATSPRLGSNRVILRTDPEFELATNVLDLLQNFRWSACRPFVFWHGFLVRDDTLARELLEVSSADIEGIEYYRDFASMPLSYRGDVGTAPLSAIRRCGVIAIWPRRS